MRLEYAGTQIARLSRNLRWLRNTPAYGRLSQQWVANKLGISRATYARYEGGMRVPPFWVLENLSVLYQIPVDRILSRELWKERW